MKLKCSSCNHIGDSTDDDFDTMTIPYKKGYEPMVTHDHIPCIDVDWPVDGLPQQIGGKAFPVEEEE